MRRLFPIIVLTAALLPQAVAQTVQFSATAVETAGEGKTTMSKLYVGDGMVRTESTYEEQIRVSIVDDKRRIAWMLNPDKREYVEMRGPAPGETAQASQPQLPDDPGSPCLAGREDFRCKKLGVENVNGRPADKWEFISTQQGQTRRAVFWFDRKLRTPIRKEFPGGHVSELRDIKEGAQPVGLFTVPEGYKRIELPTQPQGQGAGPDGRPGY